LSSEIARIRQQINTELEAMKRGLYGVAAGTAKHQFIQARFQRIGDLGDTLTRYVRHQISISYDLSGQQWRIEKQSNRVCLLYRLWTAIRRW
jgi:hypothetical protein